MSGCQRETTGEDVGDRVGLDVGSSETVGFEVGLEVGDVAVGAWVGDVVGCS